MGGRLVNSLGQPIDGKGALRTRATGARFANAPGITEREYLADQLVTGVSIVDTLFPFVRGQRMAVLGDGKSGKSAFLAQLTRANAGSDLTFVHVLISKRKADVDKLLTELDESGAIKNSIVVVADVFDSLAQSFIAPYVGCAMAEYFWQKGKDSVVIYDDLSNHAKVHREISLLSRVSPGRDSYPGDMFYAHSSLLERAGKLARNSATLTALPVMLTPEEDITAFLPTNIMSITDGQIIFDLESFRKGIRPAVNAGLSVSRVGGRGQNDRQKQLSKDLFKALARYRRAEQFSHYTSDLALEAQQDVSLGEAIYAAYRQLPREVYSMPQQIALLEAVVAGSELSMDDLKKGLEKVKTEKDADTFVRQSTAKRKKS